MKADLDIAKEWLDLSRVHKNTLDRSIKLYLNSEIHTLSYFVFSRRQVIKICNNPEWMQIFLDAELYQDHQRYSDEISNIPNNDCYFICRDNVPQNALTSMMAKHNLHSIISLYIKHPGFVEMFGMARQGPKTDMASFYLNRYDNILSCIFYIRNTLHLHKMLQISQHCYTYKDDVIKFSTAPHLSLSSREEQCLIMYLNALSAKQIAQKLELSTRTVEHYIENIKMKIGCQYKSEIIDYFQKNTLPLYMQTKGVLNNCNNSLETLNKLTKNST